MYFDEKGPGSPPAGHRLKQALALVRMYLIGVLLVLAALALAGCMAPGENRDARGGVAADSELSIGGWQVETLPDGTVLVLPGSITHDVRQPRAEPMGDSGGAGWVVWAGVAVISTALGAWVWLSRGSRTDG